MAMHFFTFMSQPTPNAEEFAEFEGAYVNCWIRNDNRDEAQARAIELIRDYGWTVDALEDSGTVSSEDYQEGDEDREFYEQALVEGEVLVFNTWPRGEDDEDSEEAEDEP
ncbi:MAG TPA: hypothetical protein VNW71_11630 [Thermoanaerobaculia bacterium]|nr:hypothetical protein [Thermoanaerobaculia bacterium]